MKLAEVSECIKSGDDFNICNVIDRMMRSGIDGKTILNNYLIPEMKIVSNEYKNKKLYLPDFMLAIRAFETGSSFLVNEKGIKFDYIGKAVIGTVQYDLHELGKNLVCAMMNIYGIEVFDLGVDVCMEKFIDKSIEVQADIIAMSALLTNTMINMKAVIDELYKRKIRDKFAVMVGGAPLTQSFANGIGADYYTNNAVCAAEVAVEFLRENKHGRIGKEIFD